MNFLHNNYFSRIRIISFFISITLSCSSPLVFLDTTGEISLALELGPMKAAVSDLDTIPVSYRIEGSNITGSEFDVTTSDTNIQFPDLKPGTWQIRVRAYNAASQVIAEGAGILEVQPGGYSSMTIILYSTAGTGTLDFSLIWNSDLVYNAILEISLKNLNGELIPMTYNQDTGTAAGLTENLAAGFYTLQVHLLDDSQSVMGAMELVQIREGGETDIHLDFSLINKAGQRVPVNTESFTISWDVEDPSVDLYNIYYREHGSFTWFYLGSTESGSTLEYTIDQGVLPYGVYDMAVSSVADSQESELHTSMDDTALPATGWYIDWQGL